MQVLKVGTVSTNIYLRRLHNFCLDMDWLLKPIIPKRQWPGIEFKEKRGITREEHQKIVAGESNAELRDYYEVYPIVVLLIAYSMTTILQHSVVQVGTS